ncbi:MAG: hypothetical protein NTX25_06290, partial [Proteobacteria bacterium]|nr:hypothetical protein [Pseudomonadota bacterium]
MRVFGRLFFCLAYLIYTSTELRAQSSTVQSSNPDISVSVLSLFKHSKRQGAQQAEADGGMSMQEAELQFTANVDPYLRAAVLLSIHPSEEATATKSPDDAAAAEPSEKSFAIEPEEVYLETIALPFINLKAGRFHAALGRHNILHAHAFPFIDAPLINQALLGPDGLTEVGLSAAGLIPAPWFMEATVQALQGDSPSLFASESSSDIASVYRLRNLFELSESATLDLGLSGASGHNFYNEQTKVKGADLTLKWRPTKAGKYQSVIFTGEYLKGNCGGRPLNSELTGYATWIQYQFAE